MRVLNEQHSPLQIDGVTTIFPGVRALDNVTFSVLASKVHGPVGAGLKLDAGATLHR
jgi:ribose transport system ATP-binding protein